jgi:putative ATP-binding cassette transporter
MREWLTRDLLDQWVTGKRPYLLGFAGDIAVNPDQRMQADALSLTESSIALGIGLIRSTLQLLSFLGVLWALSANAVFMIGGEEVHIPGYLVWCALIYAVVGSWLTWKVGKPLIAINAERYAREAELRFSLVRISEHAEAIALFDGEKDERRALERPIDRVVDITRKLANALARLTWVTSGYGWLALVVPVLAASPGYFQGMLSFGGLMMAVGAFNQVQAALRWFVDSFPLIANWRATLLRVAAFRDVLPTLDAMTQGQGRIDYRDSIDGRITFASLRVGVDGGDLSLDQDHIVLQPGERLLIHGERGAGKSVMIRAMAGIWTWGGGVIERPPRDRLMFVPQEPYLPPGSLMAALVYPSDHERITDKDALAALTRVGLAQFADALHVEARWDQKLSLEQQQRLIIARILLHRPAAVFMDEALNMIDVDRRAFLTSILDGELRGTTLVSVGNAADHDGIYGRNARIIRNIDSDSA